MELFFYKEVIVILAKMMRSLKGMCCTVIFFVLLNKKSVQDCEKGLDIAKPDDWDSVEVGLERWDVILRHLQCAALLRSLLGSTHTSLADLTRSGLAFYREQVHFFVQR